MIHSPLRFGTIESSVVFQRRRRQSSNRRRKQPTLAVQSLEPRLALAVAVGADVPKAAPLQTDVTAPEIRSVKAPKAGVYGAERRLAFQVNFTEPVVATGAPTLPITIGDSVRQAAWNGKSSGSKSLIFTLVVQSGDFAPGGVRVAGPIVLADGAAIRDKAGNNLNPAAFGQFPRARVDAIGPSVMEFGQIAVAGKRVSMRVMFTEPVVVRGKLSIPFTLDAAPRQLVYQRGSGSNVLVFQYRATKRETPTVNNVAVSTPAIALGRGRILDGAGNSAVSLAQPTEIGLSATSLPENAGANAVVGMLSTTAPDAGNTFTYTLVTGAGSTDNAAFNVSGNQLRATASLDFEAKSTYSVRVRSTDQDGLFTEKAFTISVTDVAVEMFFVTVGDAGNEADGTGYGAVDYEYQIGTYEVTIGQYTAFLNAVAADDPYGLYNTEMATNLYIAGISRSGSPGSYTYSAIAPSGLTPAGANSAADRPITCVSWFDAARFANWMHNGRGSGSTETGAYTLVGGQTSGTAPAKNPGAQFYIPTENEWYKAAYYKGGSTNAGYWDYATQSDTTPGNTIGSGANQANYCPDDIFSVTQSSDWASQNYLTEVGAFTNSGSAYGTFDQTGNVWEWNDLTGEPGSSRGGRGGGWVNYAPELSSSRNASEPPAEENEQMGFRLARPV